MKKLNQAIDRFCILHPNFGIPNLMLYVVIGNVVLGLLSNFSNGNFLSFFSYTLSGLLHGQVWRLITFVLIPESTSPFYLLITCYFYYWIGTSLERQWGTARFNLYYWSGVLLTAIVTIAASAISGTGYPVGGTEYVNLSMFFAFAFLFPDTTVLFMFFLPVKMKWLAYLDGALFAFDIIQGIGAHNWADVVLPVVALLNFAVFIWPEVHYLRQRAQYQTSRKTVQFKQAQQRAQQAQQRPVRQRAQRTFCGQ